MLVHPEDHHCDIFIAKSVSPPDPDYTNATPGTTSVESSVWSVPIEPGTTSASQTVKTSTVWRSAIIFLIFLLTNAVLAYWLFWVVLGCFGLFWVVLGCFGCFVNKIE
jgi:hypothetical protein